jgi:hypothetical protein
MNNAAHLVIIIITTAFRADIPSARYFLDMRDGRVDGRQMMFRYLDDRAAIDTLLADLRAAAERSGKRIEFEIRDEAAEWEARKANA